MKASQFKAAASIKSLQNRIGSISRSLPLSTMTNQMQAETAPKISLIAYPTVNVTTRKSLSVFTFSR